MMRLTAGADTPFPSAQARDGSMRIRHEAAAGGSPQGRPTASPTAHQDDPPRMKTIVIANQKGGVGKTSTLIHLAFDFQERGLHVVVIDLDTQGNASYSLQAYAGEAFASEALQGDTHALPSPQMGEDGQIALVPADDDLADSEKIPLGQAASGLQRTMDRLAETGFDVCLIDTAPSMGNSLIAALAVADFVLSPMEMAIYSTKGVQKMDATISNVRDINPKLQWLGLLPSKVDRRNPRHVAHLRELRHHHPELILPLEIGLRSSIAEAIESGVPVWRITKTAARKAAAEQRAVAEYVFNKLEIGK